MGRQRVEGAHPDLVPQVLQAARARGVQEFGVSASSVMRALERHYTGQLHAELARVRAELAKANAEVERAHTMTRAFVDQLREADTELANLRPELAEANAEIERAHDQLQEADTELAKLRAQEGAQPGTQPELQLYEVQAVRELAQVHAALREGAVLGSLGGGGGQLVVVRRAHVYDAASAPLQASTVLAQGACVCTAQGLLVAQLPLPTAGGGQ